MLRQCVVWALVCALLLPACALATEGAYLSTDDLHTIQPAYEAFLDELSALLVSRGLLDEADVEAWTLYQLGDFLQNGGYGSIVALYTPGLLEMSDGAPITLGRLSKQTDAGQLVVETLQRYSADYSPLPGLPLDAALVASDGARVDCRFRWIASDGMLMIWEDTTEQVVEVGATYIGTGRTLYWNETPDDGLTATLTLELLHPTEDRELARATLRVRAEGGCWMPEALE